MKSLKYGKDTLTLSWFRFAGQGVLLCALVLAAGCAQWYEWDLDQGNGQARVYAQPFSVVWQAVPVALNPLPVEIVDTNKKEGYYLVERRLTGSSYGERVAIFVQKLDERKTRVRVISRRVHQYNLLAENWEKPLLDQLDSQLNPQSTVSPTPAAEETQYPE